MEIQPFIMRNFQRGVIRPAAVNDATVPQNSLSWGWNVDTDNVLGSLTVRAGTTKIGGTVASGKTPLGLGKFVDSGGGHNYIFSVFTGASNATLYYNDNLGTWTASDLTSLSNSAKVRFAALGNRAFMVNGVDAMKSSANGANWTTTNCITTNSVIPSLVHRYKNKLYASGYSGFRDRVYRSSVIDPNASPTLTWSTDPSTGDWFDVNPDDDGNVTGFEDVSGLLLIFKNTGLYRYNGSQTDPDEIVDIGAPSQEAITKSQSVVYYFSGLDIRRTVGNYPEEISRPIKDIIAAIPVANWTTVNSGSDGINVYWNIGTITLGQTTYTNVQLKFSPRDESWMVRGYVDTFKFMVLVRNASGNILVGADTDGDVQQFNSGTTDNGTAIFYEAHTQEQDFGNRASWKKISDKVAVIGEFDAGTDFLIRENEEDPRSTKCKFGNRVGVSKSVSFQANWFKFIWRGTSKNKAPSLAGFYITKVADEGIIT